MKLKADYFRSSLKLFIFLIAGFMPLSGFAHKPLFDEPDSKSLEGATKIPDPEISWAVYTDLGSSTDVDFFSFEVTRPANLYAGLLVPMRDDYRNFYPVYAIVGPGLPAPAPALKLPFALPKGYGAVLVSGKPAELRPSFYEPFSQTNYYHGIPDFEQEVAQTGTYYMVVWHPGGEYGSYCAVIGRGEKWGWKDIVPAIKAVLKIKRHWVITPGKPAAK